MSLYAIKPSFVRRLRRLEDLLVERGTSPHRLTATAVVASALAGAAIAAGGILDEPLLWLAVPPLVLVRLAANALDGSVARRTGRAGPWGAVVNEVGDRVSDVVVVGATATVVAPGLAAGAVAAGLLASGAGVLSELATGARDSGGPLGKADRAALVAIASAWAAASGPEPFTVAAWAIVVGATLTAALRVARVRRRLRATRPALEPRWVEFEPEPVPELFDGR